MPVVPVRILSKIWQNGLDKNREIWALSDQESWCPFGCSIPVLCELPFATRLRRVACVGKALQGNYDAGTGKLPDG